MVAPTASAGQGTGVIAEGFVYGDNGTYQATFTAPKIIRGMVVARNTGVGGAWELATAGGATHINDFNVIDSEKPLNELKHKVFSPGSIVMVLIPTGGTGTPEKEAVLSATDGCVIDRTAEPKNKVCGIFRGHPTTLNSSTPHAAITGPAGIYMEVLGRQLI